MLKNMSNSFKTSQVHSFFGQAPSVDLICHHDVKYAR